MAAVLHSIYAYCAQLLTGNSRADAQHRGFAFVEFYEEIDAADAVDNMHLSELHGKTIKVNIAREIRNRPTHRAPWMDPAWTDPAATGAQDEHVEEDD